MAGATLHHHIIAMHEWLSETVLERQQRLESAISDALQREAALHEAAVKNMHRLRALRLECGQSKPVVKGETLLVVSKNKSAPNGPSPINEPPPPIDDPPKPPQPDEPPKPPPANDPPPEEKPPPMRAAAGTARQPSRS